MCTNVNNTGVKLASGKGKGAEGVISVLKMCKLYADDQSDIDYSAIRMINALSRALDSVDVLLGQPEWLDCDYELWRFADDQRLLTITSRIWLGHDYQAVLHCENLALSEGAYCSRCAIEAVIRFEGTVITEKPLVFQIEGNDDGGLSEWLTTMAKTLGHLPQDNYSFSEVTE